MGPEHGEPCRVLEDQLGRASGQGPLKIQTYVDLHVFSAHGEQPDFLFEDIIVFIEPKSSPRRARYAGVVVHDGSIQWSPHDSELVGRTWAQKRA